MVEGIIHIGAHVMSEIEIVFPQFFARGIFIEAMPQVMEELKKNLVQCNRKYNVDYKAINALISNSDGKDCDFVTFQRIGNESTEFFSGQSSMYEPCAENWPAPNIKIYKKIKLKTTRMTTLIKQHKIDMSQYKCMVIDVQGGELEVLKSLDDYLVKYVRNLRIEVSTKLYYQGGVLFDDVHNFLLDKGFTPDPFNNDQDFILANKLPAESCDVMYVNSAFLLYK